jgi:hypothetical protein
VTTQCFVNVFIIKFSMFNTSLLDVNLSVTLFDFQSCSTRWGGAAMSTVL